MPTVIPLDLLPAGLTLISCCAIAFAAGKLVAKRYLGRAPMVLLSLLFVCSAFAWFAAGQLWWATVFSSGAVLMWSNVTPVLLTFAAGVSGQTLGIRRKVRRALGVSMVAVATAAVPLPFARSAMLPARDLGVAQWKHGVCLQSSSVSCTPAAAATLLMQHRVSVSERAMARYCFTGANGTTPLGLYRGLSMAGSMFDLTPVVLPKDADALGSSPHLPAVALVRLEMQDFGSEESPIRQWIRRHQGHAVVVYGQDAGGQWIIADPAVGRVMWSDEAFRSVWTGEAVALIRPEDRI